MCCAAAILVSFSIIVEIGLMLKYAKGLDFCEKPNYAHLKHLLKSAFTAAEFEYDFKFDWLDPAIIESHPNMYIVIQSSKPQKRTQSRNTTKSKGYTKTPKGDSLAVNITNLQCDAIDLELDGMEAHSPSNTKSPRKK